MATELWWLLGKPQIGKRLQDIIGDMKEDEEGILLMTLNQIQEAIDLMAGLRSELYKFTDNKHFNFNPDEIDWDMKEYSDLISHWKNPDGTETYTLVNALYNAEETENYLRGALRIGRPVTFAQIRHGIKDSDLYSISYQLEDGRNDTIADLEYLKKLGVLPVCNLEEYPYVDLATRLAMCGEEDN